MAVVVVSVVSRNAAVVMLVVPVLFIRSLPFLWWTIIGEVVIWVSLVRRHIDPINVKIML